MNGWSPAFIASPVFLQTPLQTSEWRRVRYQAFRRRKWLCELCGRSKHVRAKLNCDQIRPRRARPHLALNLSNLQILCGDGPEDSCNEGKGNAAMTTGGGPALGG